MKDTDFRKWYGPVSGIEVNREGEVRRRYKSQSQYPDRLNYPKLRIDEDGNLCVLADGTRLRVDHLVACCFCHNPEKNEYVLHRDGDKKNCSSGNLQWVNAYVFNKMNGTTDWGVCKTDFRVSKAGEVMYNGKIETLSHSFYDSDTDLEMPSRPYVVKGMFNQCHFYVDELVAAAWIKYPDQTDSITDPVLLHIDNDYKNCKLENLKWVERDSKEYQEYMAKLKENMAEEKIKLNPKLKK